MNDVTAAQIMVFFKYLETSPRSILIVRTKNTSVVVIIGRSYVVKTGRLKRSQFSILIKSKKKILPENT